MGMWNYFVFGVLGNCLVIMKFMVYAVLVSLMLFAINGRWIDEGGYCGGGGVIFLVRVEMVDVAIVVFMVRVNVD